MTESRPLYCTYSYDQVPNLADFNVGTEPATEPPSDSRSLSDHLASKRPNLKRTNPRLASGLLLGCLILSGCGGEEDGPIDISGGPGTMTATLQSPNGPEGGALIHLVGNGATNVMAPVGDLFTSVSGDTVKVLLLRQDPGELIFSFSLPDTTRRPTILIEQVTGGDNQLRASLSGYTLRLAR